MLNEIFRAADGMRAVAASGGSDILRGRRMLVLFYEPSTRTLVSFQSAMELLGGRVTTAEHGGQFSSAIKGESLADTIRVVNGYHYDVIVLRHYQEGAAAQAAELSTAPVINAGDGTGQHPTQSLLDLYTIEQELGGIDGVSVALVGDLARGRTVRSLAYLLAKFRVGTLYFAAGDGMQAGKDILDYLTRHDVKYELTSSLAGVAGKVDVVYVTRLQRERLGDGGARLEAAYRANLVTPEILCLMKHRSIILHPLPRVNEISPEVDADPRAAYFRQAENGLYIRMVLLRMLLT